MRPDSRPVNITLKLTSLPENAVVFKIQDCLYEILDFFMPHYGHHLARFYDACSYDNFV